MFEFKIIDPNHYAYYEFAYPEKYGVKYWCTKWSHQGSRYAYIKRINVN